MSTSKPRPIPKRVFQAVALATMPAPFVATYFATPAALAFTGHPEGAVMVLVAVTTLLVMTVAWALVLLPLRRFSQMPTLRDEMALSGASSVGEMFERARAEQASLQSATDPTLRRRYHFRMALGGGVLGLATGAVTYAMMIQPGGNFFVALPVIAATSLVLAAYHLVRALSIRTGR
jgi:hypothetical protein